MAAKKFSAAKQVGKQVGRKACSGAVSGLSIEEDKKESMLLYHDFFIYADALKIETENILKKKCGEIKEAEKNADRKDRNAMINDIVSILISRGIITQRHARYARDFISEKFP